MNSPADALDAITGDLADSVACGDVRGLADDVLVATIGAIERLGRRVDALRVAAAAEVGERSRKELGLTGLAAKKGCRNASELMQRLTCASGVSIERRLALGLQTRAQLSLTGIEFPARFPRVAEALGSGSLGADSAAAIINGLLPVIDHAAIDDLASAERELVAAATGSGPESSVPCAADESRVQAQVWRTALDPDGLVPAEERALARRGFRIGSEHGGLVPVSGGLLPEIAGKFARLFDAYLAPKTAPVFVPEGDIGAGDVTAGDVTAGDVDDGHVARGHVGGRRAEVAVKDPRSFDQRRHDILASIIDAAARSGETPAVGGAAPTVLVSVRRDDLERRRGAGFIDGVPSPISMRAVEQFVCSGGTQTVELDARGRIISLGSPQRCFTPRQRRAITLRDGGCLIPGCQIPAGWCEIHHVKPDAAGGETHTDNGVLLCWFHHRTIETSGWQVRMIRGAPQIKAPPWLDSGARWRSASRSRTSLTDAIARALG
ncbi:MAG TPA: DUF222 domain-containing protein [Microbacteriaceae bacterium]|jgi:hypothetical protein|nr:DUF222 domain-containing protein [Microbacteriaceae bacterium]